MNEVYEGQEATAPAGLSRRTALKRGAVIAGTAVWTVPLMQVIAMSPAAAESPSGSTVPPVNNPGPTPGGTPQDPLGPLVLGDNAHSAVKPTPTARDTATTAGGDTVSAGELASTGASPGHTAVLGVAAVALGAAAVVAGRQGKPAADSAVSEHD